MEKLTDHVTRISGLISEYMYLVEGSERALLIDSGCGAGDIRSFVESLTSLPLSVVLTHGHYDHAGGAGRFEEVWINSVELKPTPIHYDRSQTFEKLKAWHPSLRVEDMSPDSVFCLDNESSGDDGFGAFPSDCSVSALDGSGKASVLCHPLTAGMQFSLGGISVEAIPCPGHTPGTFCMLIVEDRLLLTGDACHSISYLFFDNALSIEEYLENLCILKQQEERWDSLLLSHPIGAAPKSMLDEVIHLCDEILKGATDEVPYDYQGKPAFIAKAVDENMLRRDGVYGNIIFRKDKLRKKH